jgi:hypothetical protein
MKIKNISIKGAHNKPILLDVCYEKSNIKKPLVVFCHGYKGYKDWGAFDLMSDYFVKNDLFLLIFLIWKLLDTTITPKNKMT